MEKNNEVLRKPLNYRRTTYKRHVSFRIALCKNKEAQLQNLAKLDPKGAKRHSVMVGQPNFLNFGIFNFEKEEADEDDEIIEEDEKINEIEEEKTKEGNNKAKQETTQNKAENEDKKDNEDEEDFDPLNEKGDLKIPLKTKNKFKKDDFDVVALSGKGAYGTVLKVKFKNDKSGNFYAIKTMDISALERIHKLYQAYLECDILSQLDSPYIVDILGAFDENSKIYIVMQYLSKGDFSDFIRLNYPLKHDTIQFYAAEVVNFLDYIQSKKIVHRDLKPENIMMNSNWHLQVIDFATARILGKYFDKQKFEFKNDSYYDISETDDLKGNKVAINDEDDFDEGPSGRSDRRGLTFVGTAEYVSPEVLGDKPAEFGADIWALGIMIYQMYFGKTPFKEKTNYLIFRKIEQLKIEFDPKVNIPEEAKDIITKILVKEPNKRLGAGEPGSEYDIKHLKSHSYFKGIDWNNLHNISPPNSEKFDSLMSKKGNIEKTDSLKSNNMCDVGVTRLKTYEENSSKYITLRRGYLDKKSPWLHYNKRKVIVDSSPKIIYIDPSTEKIKGEIYLDKKFKVVHVGENTFDLISPKRSFRFKACDGDALVWEKIIIEAIKKYGK